MKKPKKLLGLHKETLRSLDKEQLKHVPGMTTRICSIGVCPTNATSRCVC